MSDRMPTPGTASAARMGEMAVPTTVGRHKLSGTCPDGHKCTLPVYCSQLCSRLQSAEITAEMQANVRARRPTTKKPPAPPPADIRAEETPMDEPAEETVPPPGHGHHRPAMQDQRLHEPRRGEARPLRQPLLRASGIRD